MKRIGWLMITLAFPAIMSGQQQPAPSPAKEGFEIVGEVSGLLSGQTVYLQDRDSQWITDTLARSVSEKGRFVLRMPAMLPGMLCYIEIKGIKQLLPVFTDDTPVHLKGLVSRWPDVVYSGSKVNEDFVQFRRVLTSRDVFFENVFLPEPQLFYALMLEKATASYVAGKDLLFREWADRYTIYSEILKEFIRQHPNSAFSAFLLGGTFLYDVQKHHRNFQPLYNGLTKYAKNSYCGTQLRYAEAVLKEEEKIMYQPTPEISGITHLGNTFSLKELSKKSKVVLVEFWATDCELCRRRTAFYKRLLKDFGPKGLAIVGYSHDASEQRWKTTIIKDGTMAFQHLTVARDRDKKAIRDFKTLGVYTTFLIDEKGILIAKGLNEIDLYDLIRQQTL